MTVENQLKSWLNRSEKTFLESLVFAIRAMCNSEFTFSKKYEIILNWIAEEGGKQKVLPCKEMKEVLDLRLQSTLVPFEIKDKFVQMFLTHGNQAGLVADYPSLLCKLLATEWLQDLLQSKHTVKAQVYGLFFECFGKYLSSKKASKDAKLSAEETGLFTQALNLLKDHTQSAAKKIKLANEYDRHILQPLSEVLLVLRSKYNIDFFDELRQIEQLLRVCTVETVNTIIEQLPMHSSLVILECVLANQRLEQNLQIGVLKCVFRECKRREANIVLQRAAYLLNILQKHNMQLNYEIDGKNVLHFLGSHIYQYTSDFKETNLDDVLLLLCAALRLNPLILEQHIFELTTWVIVTSKNTENIVKTHVLFEEYLILLLEMFRRLSRAEKFVVNLLKALNKWLSENELVPASKKQNKRKLAEQLDTPRKKEKFDTGAIQVENSDSNSNVSSYMAMIFEAFNKQNQALKYAAAPKILQNSFTHLHAAWPSDTIGFAFSRLITGLVTKASLTIWKTLLYALKDQLALLSQENMSSVTENAHFRLDIHAALLCQYFAGAKLNEQFEKHAADIKQQRDLTKEVLTNFGKFVLNHEYHKRSIAAFMECCYYAANFELLLAYYKPDGFIDDSLVADKLVPNLHSFLSLKEWSVIQQRIRNYGKSHERKLYERLIMQRAEAEQLLQLTGQPAKRLTSLLSCDADATSMAQFLSSTPHASWLIEQFDRSEKIALITYKCENLTTLNAENFIELVKGNSEALELLAYGVFERFFVEFISNNKSSSIAALKCNFDLIRQCSPQDHIEYDKIIKSLVLAINEQFGRHKVKNIPMETIATVLLLLTQMPLGHMRRQTKTLLFVFYLAFYQDLKIAQAQDEAKQLLDCLTDFLHFGPQVPIFRYFEMKKILELLPIVDCWKFYEFLFSTIKNEEKGTDEFLKSLEQMLQNELETTATLKGEQRRLLLIAIESFASFNGVIGRRIFKHFQSLLEIYGNYVYGFFETEMNAQNSKKFVEKTLEGFAPFAKAVLLNASNNSKSKEKHEENEIEEKETKEHQSSKLKPLDEDFRRICKIYIGNSMDYRNPHAIRLMQVALNNRKLLHLDQDEIELVLRGYWRQLNADMQQQQPLGVLQTDDTTIDVGNMSTNDTSTTTNALKEKNSEALMRMIIENKTNEDLLLTLKDIGSNVLNSQNFAIALEMLTLIAKSKFSTIKGAIFNEQFKQITSNIVKRLVKNQKQQFIEQNIVLKLMSLQQICADNKTIPVTPDTLDCILAFLIDINIKKFILTDINGVEFFALHAAMTSLCATLIKQRHILLMDRVPELMQIFKDLIQAIIQYRSERQKETALDTKELDQLAELALKLEVLIHNIAAHSTDVKRVAPFVLIFIINLTVTCNRPTTLYSKIKTHIDAICYSLIGICDHRVGRFILRCSNEAARQSYELLVKDHKKYHKFKGKV